MSDSQLIIAPRRGRIITSRFLTTLAATANTRRNLSGGYGVNARETRNGTILEPKLPRRVGRKTGTVTAILTSRDTTNKHIAAWSEVEINDVGTASILLGGRTGTPTDEPAIELSKNPFAFSPDPVSGDIVQLERRTSSTGKIFWAMDHSFLSTFQAFVKNDGGVAGDSTTDCTFTYEILTIDSVTINTGLTPKRPRYPKTTYIVAPDFSIGLVAWNGPFAPNSVLDIAIEEIEKSRVC